MKYIFIIFGICSVFIPSLIFADTQILLPNAVGSVNDAAIATRCPNSGEAKWEDVDDYPADDATTYLSCGSGSSVYESFGLQNPTTTSGTIDSVSVYYTAGGNTGNSNCSFTAGSAGHAQGCLYLSGSRLCGTDHSDVADWTEYSDAISRPGGGSWTWTDINNLEAEIMLNSSVDYSDLTNIYVVVEYTPATGTGPAFAGQLTFPWVLITILAAFILCFIIDKGGARIIGLVEGMYRYKF